MSDKKGSTVVHLVSSESLLLFILCPLKVYCCSSCVLWKSTVVHLVSSVSLLLFILCPLKVYCCSSCVLWKSTVVHLVSSEIHGLQICFKLISTVLHFFQSSWQNKIPRTEESQSKPKFVLYANKPMPDLQQYSWKLCLIKY